MADLIEVALTVPAPPPGWVVSGYDHVLPDCMYLGGGGWTKWVDEKPSCGRYLTARQEKQKDQLVRIGHRLHRQDNRATALPMFLVKQKRRIIGMSPEYTDLSYWVDKEGEPVEDGDNVDPEKHEQVGYLDIYEFVTACFTEQGCLDYIAANRHNLNNPVIYVASGYRNQEWEEVRDFLLSLSTPPMSSAGVLRIN